MIILSSRSIVLTFSLALITAETSLCHSFSVSSVKTNVPILTVSDESSEKEPNFDIGCVANPVVLPPHKDCPDGEWQCYYYGNAGSWNGGRNCFLPTGSSGLAVSKDGLSWTKVIGKESDGSILTPSSVGSGEWDSVHTGVGDVIRIDKDELHMYYFGSSEEEIKMDYGNSVGLRMRIGRAKSFDNGRTWTKDSGYVLDYDETEGFFASWPRIVTFDDDDQAWQMYYHSFDGKKWRVYYAESSDKGDTWARKGLVIEGGESDDDFDNCGIGTRSVVKWRDGLLMIYEGVDGVFTSTHRLGAAFSKDGENWAKLNEGKPILEPGKGPMGGWTKQVIGTPFVLNMPDGSLRLYHCAKSGPDSKMGIGAVVSESGDIEPECWTAF
mmetsp:Transcript_27182/g.31644  ORF Transcript_27182/g.31644 Transcript_27182/m.31644 type:complete len:382 (+) Transcript_27182:97-1242(+)